MDSILDRAVSGPRYLMLPEIARLMVDALRHGDEKMGRYGLHAYVVMANHVHLLITPHVGVMEITRSLKRFTARAANRILGLTGHRFWQDESYDHLVRNQREFDRIWRYIEINPVKAGAASEATGFPWSSASGRLQIGRRDAIPPHFKPRAGCPIGLHAGGD